MRRAAVSALALLALARCGPDEPPRPPEPEPELPPIGEVAPSEAVRMDEEKFIELPPPAERRTLRWDFSAGRRWAYDVSQRLSRVTVASSGGRRAVTRAEDRNEGYFEFIALGDGTAQARVKIQTRESLVDGRPAPREAVERHPPTKFECRIGEDGIPTTGRLLSGASDPVIFFDSLLALQEGERKTAHGASRTRLTGYFKVERHECARLESEFEYAPPIPSGRTLLRGRSVSYFSLRERRFVRAEASIAQAIRSKARPEGGAWVVQSTDLETLIRLRPME